jgi:putative endonuclease
LLSRIIFGFMELAARNGLAGDATSVNGSKTPVDAQTQRGLARRRTGVRGETFAYWYLRRHGYTIVARNFTSTGCKGEIDLIGYDGSVLAFVEVKTRTGDSATMKVPEDAVTPDKRHHLTRMARQFLSQRRVRDAVWRFDVVAIESHAGQRPTVRLHKGAFAGR